MEELIEKLEARLIDTNTKLSNEREKAQQLHMRAHESDLECTTLEARYDQLRSAIEVLKEP